jgi:hypothetical protein
MSYEKIVTLFDTAQHAEAANESTQHGGRAGKGAPTWAA